MKANPILLEVFKNRFSSIADEMGVVLGKTAFSPNIKERRDFSCAVFDKNGDMIAQAAHIPVHLGSMPLSVKSAIESCVMEPGDMVALNDPFKGGTHLPDITIVAPVFLDDDEVPSYYVANRAHHADVGGISAGSMPLSTQLYQEGIIIPPVKIIRKNIPDGQMMDFILNNVRTPFEREGDFKAQFMSNLTGIARLKELINKYGSDEVAKYADHLMDYSEKVMRAAIAEIPDGKYTFRDYMDDDGQGALDINIEVAVSVKGERVICDFSGTHRQVKGSINAVYSITCSAVYYIFRSLIESDIPTNAGCFRPIMVVTEKGSVVDADFPAAVAAGNVETSQRIVDVVLGALSRALPEKIPAASQGTMNNTTIGGFDPYKNQPFAYYETLAGGMGASKKIAGESAVHSHMTNTLNTPVEAIEYSYPMRVVEYSIRRDSGGRGEQRGGNGLIRDIELLCEAEVTVLSERRVREPYSAGNGEPGHNGMNLVVKGGKKQKMPGKFTVILQNGERIRIETPGGGGYS